jgi:hypothetical protein
VRRLPHGFGSIPWQDGSLLVSTPQRKYAVRQRARLPMGSPPPENWFQCLLYPDGTLYCAEEILEIHNFRFRDLTARGDDTKVLELLEYRSQLRASRTSVCERFRLTTRLGLQSWNRLYLAQRGKPDAASSSAAFLPPASPIPAMRRLIELSCGREAADGHRRRTFSNHVRGAGTHRRRHSFGFSHGADWQMMHASQAAAAPAS